MHTSVNWEFPLKSPEDKAKTSSADASVNGQETFCPSWVAEWGEGGGPLAGYFIALHYAAACSGADIWNSSDKHIPSCFSQPAYITRQKFGRKACFSDVRRQAKCFQHVFKDSKHCKHWLLAGQMFTQIFDLFCFSIFRTVR